MAARLALACAPLAFFGGVFAATGPTGAGHGDFVSELGVAGASGADVFHAGLTAAAAALFVAAGLGRGRLPGGWPTAGALVVMGAALLVARVYPCSARCPIPGIDPTPTLSDVVHVAASSMALGATVGSAAWVATTGAAGPRWSAVCAGFAAVVALSSGAFLLVVALHIRPTLGYVERGLFAVVAGWLWALAAHPSR